MENSDATERNVLTAYLGVDEKLRGAALPATLERQLVVDRLKSELANPQKLSRLNRIARLAAFYNTYEHADAFLRIAAQPASDYPSFEQSMVATETIGWIGNEATQNLARSSLGRALSTTQPEKIIRMRVAKVFRAWGDTLDPAVLSGWVQKGETRQLKLLEQAQAAGNMAQAETIEDEIDALRAFRDLEVGIANNENALRTETTALPEQERIPRLAELYLIDTPGSSEYIAYWAAISLVRLRDAAPELELQIGKSFAALSTRFLEPTAEAIASAEEQEQDEDIEADEPFDALPLDPDDVPDVDELAEEKALKQAESELGYSDDDIQLELDLARARCLRAAIFFGILLTDEDAEWLARQNDHGTDLLAVRTDWDY